MRRRLKSCKRSRRRTRNPNGGSANTSGGCSQSQPRKRETAVDEATWQAFWRTAVDGQPARDVAEALQMSVGAVYVAKSRVVARIKQHVAEIEGNET